MTDTTQTGPSTDLQRPAQYPTATRIENGTAYDMAGKALGPVDDGQQPQPQGDDFFAKLGGQPVQTAQPPAQSDQSDDFFAKLGGTPVQSAQQGEEIRQKALQSGKSTIGPSRPDSGVISRIAGTFNTNTSLGLGSNIVDVYNNVKNWINSPVEERQALVPNLVKSALDAQGHELQTGIDSIKGPGLLNKAGGVVRYAQGLVPLLGPMVGAIEDHLGRGEYAEATGTTAALLIPGVAEHFGPRVAARLDNALNASKNAQISLDARSSEAKVASNQADAAAKQADQARQDHAAGKINTDQRVQAEENASQAVANSNRAQEAVKQAEEAKANAGYSVKKVQRTLSTQQTATNGAKQAQNQADAFENFKRMAPPATKGPAQYTDQQLHTALGYTEQQHNAKPLKTVKDFYSAMEQAKDDMDTQIDPHIEKYGNEPISTNVRMDVRDQLADNPNTDFVEEGMKSLEPYNLTDPTIAEAKELITQFNAETRAKLSQNHWNVTTALRVDPEFAAKYHALESLRNGTYGALDDAGVSGIRKMQQDRAAIINVQNAVEKQMEKGNQVVRGSGQPGLLRKAAQQMVNKGALAVGASKGGALGALAADHYTNPQSRLGRAILTGDMTRDDLAAKIHSKPGVGRPITTIEDNGRPAEAPAFPTPPVPSTALAPEDMQAIMRENTPLHSELATHYGVFSGENSYQDLERRFMDDIADKQEHGVTLEAPEKTLLGKINAQNDADIMTAKKAAQKQAEQAAERQAAGKEPETEPTATLPNNAEPALQVPQSRLQNGMDTQSAIVHDLAHKIVADEVLGDSLPSQGISSHLDESNKNSGRLMSAEFDWSNFTDEDGNLDPAKIAPKIQDFATMYVAGGVANDLFHNIPFDQNHHLGADLRVLRKLMTLVDIPKEEQVRIVQDAGRRAAEILSRPGVEQVMHDHAAVREPGLESSMHMSPERVQQVIQDVKGGEDVNTKHGTAGSDGKANRSAKPGTEESGRRGANPEAEGQSKEGLPKEGKAGGEAATAARGGAESAAATGEQASAAKPEQPALSEPIEHRETERGGELRIDQEGKNKGLVKYTVTAPDTAAITAARLEPELQGKGLGKKLYTQAADQARQRGLKYLTSDLGGTDSFDSARTWDSLMKDNPQIEKFANKAGSPGYRWNLQEAAQPENPALSNEDLKKGMKETSTGVPEHDQAIKAAGAIPAGTLKGMPEIGLEHHALYHDPTSGSTLATKFSDMNEQAVRDNLARSRADYAAAEAKNKPENPALSSDRVSTRLPFAKKATENPLEGEPLTVGMQAVPERLQQKFANTVRKYPGVKIPEGVKDPAKINERFVNHVKDNLKFLYDQVDPAKREQTAKWYESANKLAKDLAAKHDISEPQAAGVIATQSPQKDWDMNVSLARRIADIYANQKDTVATPEMIQKGRDIVQNTGANKDLEKVLPFLEGKKFSELPDETSLQKYARAAWTRLFDEAHNSRDFHYIDPGTGENHGLRTNADGSPSKVAWGSLPQINNALSILDNGERPNISERLGSQHKVRNFYNNIIDPTNPDDVTIDTHAVAAGLIQPLGGSAKEVLHNFGGAGKDAATGTSGTYPLYAEAYRQAAKDLGIKARELQSVVWEHVREMFPSEWKSPENEKLVKSVWKKYSDGKQNLNQTRQQILKISEDAQKQVNDKRADVQAKVEAKKQKLDKSQKLAYTDGMKALGGE